MTDSGQRPSCDMTLVTLKFLSPKQPFKIAIPIKSSILHLTNAFASTPLYRIQLIYAPVLLFFLSFGVSKNENKIRMTNLMYVIKPYYYVYLKLFQYFKKKETKNIRHQGLIYKDNLGSSSHTNLFFSFETGGLGFTVNLLKEGYEALGQEAIALLSSLAMIGLA